MPGWMNESQAGIKAVGRNINNLRYADNTTLIAGSKEELKNLLMKVKESKRKKTWLKTQHSKNKDQGIWSHNIMAKRWGKSGNSYRFCFTGLQNHFRQGL